MNMKVVRKEENLLELLLEDVDLSIPQILQAELLSDEAVEFAAYRRSHPLERKYFLVVRAKDGQPKDALIRAAKRAIERASRLSEAIGEGLGVS